eukprot:462498_1
MSGHDIGEWSGVCDDVPTKKILYIIPCHCGINKENSYSSITCHIIDQQPFTKGLSIFIFSYCLIVIVLCLYWLITFWRHREMRAYKFSLKVRRPFYMILSYLLILLFIFEDSIATVYLFWANVTPPRNQQWDGVNWWTQYDGTPIYFNKIADIVLHFFYWFGFWSFFQLKIFKLWMLRHDYEYSKEMHSIEWKDHLGLRTVEPTSFLIRHRSILGNSFLMFFLQLVILVVIILIQILIRSVPSLQESPLASSIEAITILTISTSEFIFIVWLMRQTREVHDIFFLKAESKRIFFVSLIGGIAWIIGLIIAHAHYAGIATNIGFIWGKSAASILFATWLCVFCYFETIWLLKRIDFEWAHRNIKKYRKKTNDINMYAYLKLGDILQCQEGFEAMVRFLVKEFSCENLLCYVELSQYICTWAINDIDSIHSNSRSEHLKVEQFPYFENPEFEDELAHYEYIMQKYIYDSASLQINISGTLRLEAQTVVPGMESDRIIKMINAIRSELWSSMRDSFTRFRSTTEYSKLADKLQHK